MSDIDTDARTEKHILPNRKKRHANTPAEMKGHEGRRTWKPVVVDGIEFEQRLKITPAEYGLLDVDPSYQRGQTRMIPHIMAALQAGGSIPDTPDVARRPWSDNEHRLWIMDGFQRVSALQELNKTFMVNVHVSKNLDSEKRFFLAMNFRRALSSNQQVKAWDGPITKLLKSLNNREDSPCFGMIEFSNLGGQRLSASILVRGIDRLMAASRTNKDIQRSLSACDAHVSTERGRSMASNYCYTMALIFEKNYARQIAALAIAEVASERWKDQRNFEPPNKTALRRLREINWKTRFPGSGSEYIDLAVSVVHKYWKS